MIRIALLDNRKLFRASLKTFFEQLDNCKVELSSGNLESIYSSNSTFDLIIIDPFSISDSTNFWIEKLQQHFAASRILILTDRIDYDLIYKSIEMNIFGYFSKEGCPNELKQLVLNSSQSQNTNTYLSKCIKENLFKTMSVPGAEKLILSKREKEILKLICKEKTNNEISAILNLSVRTIESHRRRMIEKTECKSIIGVIIKTNLLNIISYGDLWNLPHSENLGRA